MNKKNLYTIGQISRICKIPVQTLRYYDKIDLLKPAIVNKETGYRHYSNKQILNINIIQQLKEFKFSLHEIKEYLKQDDLSIIINLYNNKRLEIEEQIHELRRIEKQLRNRIENLQYNSKQGLEPYIEIKNVEEKVCVAKRYNSPCNPDAFSIRFNELKNIVKRNGWEIAGSLMAIFYDHYREFDFNNADIEAFIPIKETNKESKYTKQIPGGKYATILHKGSYESTPKSYSLLLAWIRKNGFEIIGPPIEKYIVDISVTKKPEEFVTELQFLIK